jgi:hypothetical protein
MKDCIARDRVMLAVAAIVLFAVRMPFLPPTLEDIDSVNFDLGVHDYNPVAHQPHPPGYPIFILLAKLVHPLFPSHAAGLAFLSVVCGAFAIVPMYLLFRELTSRTGAALACALIFANPIVWFNSVRPMSDLTGFLASIAGQMMLLKGSLHLSRDGAGGRRLWSAGVIVSALAIGVRLQAVWLVGPLLIYGWIRHPAIRLTTAIAFGGTLAVWIVPMIALSGGVKAYLGSFVLLVNDALPAESLIITVPTVHRAAYALWDVLVTPWGPPWVGIPVVAAAALGACLWLRSNRPALGWALLLFLPYAVYHYLLQMTETIRYAIPVVPLVALLATAPLCSLSRAWQQQLASVLGVLFVALSSLWTVPALAAYHRTPSPAASAVAFVRQYPTASDAFVVAGHHVFTRYIQQFGVAFTTLPAIPREIWRRLAEYWKQDRHKPILFLRDPARTSLLFAGNDAQTVLGRWSWPASVAPLLKGERPSGVEVLRLDPPSWFCESGFFVMDEAGLPEQVAREPHRLYARRSSRRQVLMVTGAVPADTDLTLELEDGVHTRWHARGGFTLTTMLDALAGPSRYVPLSFHSPHPVLFTDVWIGPEEQPVIRPAAGFYRPERNRAGRLFRWMAPEAHAFAYLPGGGARVTIRGEIPVKYYRLPVTISLAWDGKPLKTVSITGHEFEIEETLYGSGTGSSSGTLTLRFSQHFQPHAHQKTGDRRILAARMFELNATPLR